MDDTLENKRIKMSLLRQENFLSRLIIGDASLWQNVDGSLQIESGLEWIKVASRIQNEVAQISIAIQEIQGINFKDIVVIGMGGSSIVNDIFHNRSVKGSSRIFVINSILPYEIERILSSIDIATTLFIVISGSGETIETSALFKYFWDIALPFHDQDCKNYFVVITALDSPLNRLANEKGIIKVYYFPGSLWGRYRALGSPCFIPALLANINISEFVNSVTSAYNDLFSKNVYFGNSALELGIELSRLYERGKRNIIVNASPSLEGLAIWLTELIAESTGKGEKGFIAIQNLSLVDYQTRSEDLVLSLCINSSNFEKAKINKDCDLLLYETSEERIGYAIIKWGLAVLVFCFLNRINPFYEPQFIELSKQFQYNMQKKPNNSNFIQAVDIKNEPDTVIAALNNASFVVFHIFFQPFENFNVLISILTKCIQDKYGIPCIVTFGTRYIHSLGQQFKGGTNSGVFFQLFSYTDHQDKQLESSRNIFEYLLINLINADFEILRQHNRRVFPINIGKNLEAGFKRLMDFFAS